MRALESHGILDSGSGRIVVGWLIVEDLFTVLILALPPAPAPVLVGPQISSESASHDPGNGPLLFTFGIALGKFVGEFSFILGENSVTLHLLPAEGQSLIVAGALLSIALNSFFLRLAGAIQNRTALAVSA
jgi:monovalent cation:H+ antiporter-2, CPA2 family